MELKNSILSKTSQMQKGKNHIFSFTCKLGKMKKHFQARKNTRDVEVEEGKRGQRKGDHDQTRVYFSVAVKLTNVYD